MLDKLRFVSELIGRVPSALFALLFLCAIPGFAAFYLTIPSDFFHSTARYESGHSVKGVELLYRIKDQYLRQLKEAYGSETVEAGEYSFRIDNILFNSIRANEEIVTFQMMVFLEEAEGRPGFLEFLSVEVTFDIHWRDSFEGTLGGERAFLQTVRTKPLEFVIPSKILFPIGQTEFREEIFSPAIGLTQELMEDISKYSATHNGIPLEESGSFSRMFYFSAVTITTLGYGDIVPLTGKARLWVSIESILGLVLGGLFFNSLFRERPIAAG